MIVEEHITDYLHSLETERAPLLEEIRLAAEEAGVPVIRREMESFLRTLLLLLRPETVLEIGTGVAFSAVFLAESAETIRQITTIENYPPRIKEAEKNLARFRNEGKSSAQIRLLEEDAAKAVTRLKGEFDLIFLDGPKAQYIKMLPELLRLLRKGGVLLADNVLQDGALVRSRFATPRRERTIHERMREFIWAVKHDPALETALLTVGDGVTVSIKK